MAVFYFKLLKQGIKVKQRTQKRKKVTITIKSLTTLKEANNLKKKY